MNRKLLLTLFTLIVLNTKVFSQYSNASLNGAWFMYLTPQNPTGDSLLYLVFDGNGNVTDFSGFCSNIGGNYNVTSGGVITGTLTCDAEAFPLIGQLTSSSTGTCDVAGDVWSLIKVSNEGALAGKLDGVLYTQNCGDKSVELFINNSGIITSSGGLTPLTLPVVGRVYTELGMFIGHFKTGETDGWNQISIMGYYSNNTLTGKVSIDQSNCGNSDAGFTRSDVTSVNKLSNEASLKVFPNPSNGNYNISVINPYAKNDKTKFVITNTLGEILYTKEGFGNEIAVDLSNQPNGLYVLLVIHTNITISHKLIKK